VFVHSPMRQAPTAPYTPSPPPITSWAGSGLSFPRPPSSAGRRTPSRAHHTLTESNRSPSALAPQATVVPHHRPLSARSRISSFAPAPTPPSLRETVPVNRPPTGPLSSSSLASRYSRLQQSATDVAPPRPSGSALSAASARPHAAATDSSRVVTATGPSSTLTPATPPAAPPDLRRPYSARARSELALRHARAGLALRRASAANNGESVLHTPLVVPVPAAALAGASDVRSVSQASHQGCISRAEALQRATENLQRYRSSSEVR
jgi:hypothetical protein